MNLAARSPAPRPATRPRRYNHTPTDPPNPQDPPERAVEIRMRPLPPKASSNRGLSSSPRPARSHCGGARAGAAGADGEGQGDELCPPPTTLRVFHSRPTPPSPRHPHPQPRPHGQGRHTHHRATSPWASVTCLRRCQRTPSISGHAAGTTAPRRRIAAYAAPSMRMYASFPPPEPHARRPGPCTGRRQRVEIRITPTDQ